MRWGLVALAAALLLQGPPSELLAGGASGRDHARCIRKCNTTEKACKQRCKEVCRDGDAAEQDSCKEDCSSLCTEQKLECNQVCQANKFEPSPENP